MNSPTFSAGASNNRALYIHVPFCRHRCGYCNFTLIAGRDDLIVRYLNALATEISWVKNQHTVGSIFFGGGTPSHLEPNQLERIFEIMYSKFDLAEFGEITIECNPNDMTPELASTCARCGINRVSFGVQSFNARKLKFLERDHNEADIHRAVEVTTGFTNNFSFDLIFATFNESRKSWLEDLEKAVGLQPVHLSTYELTIEKGTQFWNRQSASHWNLPDEDQRAEQYIDGIEYLTSNGFEHYEISSFCKSGYQCRHNQSYWTGQDYFAFGPGASRFINGIRETNHRSTTTYLKRIETGQSPIAEQQSLTSSDFALDCLVFGLRQLAGISTSKFKAKTKVDLDHLLEPHRTLFENNLLTYENGNYKLTPKGVMLYDSVAAKLLG